MKKIKTTDCVRIHFRDLTRHRSRREEASGRIDSFDFSQQPIRILFKLELYINDTGYVKLRWQGKNQFVYFDNVYKRLRRYCRWLFICPLGCKRKVESIYLSDMPYFGCQRCLGLIPAQFCDNSVLRKQARDIDFVANYFKHAYTIPQKSHAVKLYNQMIWNFKRANRLKQLT